MCTISRAYSFITFLLSMTHELITPYGGTLVNLLVSPESRQELYAYAKRLPRLRLSLRSQCDLELLALGGFSPLRTFMGEADYHSVVQRMRLADGTLFPIPIALPVPLSCVLPLGSDVALCDERNDILAVMTVEEYFTASREEEALAVFGTLDTRHPLVSEMYRWSDGAPMLRYVSGALRVLRLPTHHDFVELRLSPQETRQRLATYGHTNIVAFQTRNPLHRAHEEMTKRAIEQVDGVLLLHPSVGMTRPGDVDHFTRVRTYQALTTHYYEANRVLLALLPLAMRMGGPREALLHAIIRRNYGANYFIVGRDHAGPGNDKNGTPFYAPYAAQALAKAHEAELGVTILTFQEMRYVVSEQRYEEVDKISAGTRTVTLSGTQIREQYLSKGITLPGWFTRPEVADILAQSYPPTYQHGICVWFTGLSGSGKSTTAEILATLLLEYGRQSTLLDGDIVRTHLSQGLGFSREDRDINIRRIGFVASEIARHGGIAICAAISPYRRTRDDVRQMVTAYPNSHFIEVFLNTPLEVCEARDPKGLYAQARRGELPLFTGIDDPYEPPNAPEIVLDTVHTSANENAHLIVNLLLAYGLLRDGVVYTQDASSIV